MLRRIIACAVFLLLNAGVAVRAADSPAQAEVRAIHEAYDKAWVRQDVAAFERLLAPEFEAVEPDGQINNRAAVLAMARDGSLNFEIGESRDVRIVVREGTAVVRGLWRGKGSYKGKQFNELLRYTTTYSKMDGQWKAMGDQLAILSAAAAVTQMNLRYLQGGDAAAAAATAAGWTKDAWSMAPHQPIFKIRASLESDTRTYFKRMQDENFRYEATTLETEESGEWAYNIDRYKEVKADGTVLDEGMVVGIWKLEEGEWKLHRDIWNSTLPKKDK